MVHSSDDTLSAEDLALGYQQLQRVEQAWRREQGSGLASRILVCKMAAWQGHYELNMKVRFIM